MIALVHFSIKNLGPTNLVYVVVIAWCASIIGDTVYIYTVRECFNEEVKLTTPITTVAQCHA